MTIRNDKMTNKQKQGVIHKQKTRIITLKANHTNDIRHPTSLEEILNCTLCARI